MATVKEVIAALLECDMRDEVYVNIYDGMTDKNNYYSIDGLEISFYEYNKKPTLAITGGKLNAD